MKLTNTQFIENTFKTLHLFDKRLVKRTHIICLDLLENAHSVVKKFSKNPLHQRAAYDYFSSRKVSPEALFQPHQDHTLEVIDQESTSDILVLHDTTVYNFTTHPAKIHIGRVGKGHQDYYGVAQHTSLAITPCNRPLGFLNLKYFDYDDFNTSLSRTKRPLEEKATGRWISAINHIKKLSLQKKIIHIADRESDFYGCLKSLEHEWFIIRASHKNRYVQRDSQSLRLRDLLEKQTLQKGFELSIYDTQKGAYTLSKFSCQIVKDVEIPEPHRPQKKGESPIRCHVVRVFDEEREWILYTSLPLDTREDIFKVLDYYRKRWHIESYFKVLKTTFKAEEIALHQSKEAILNLLTLLNMMALRIYWTIYSARNEENEPALKAFQECEIQALQTYLRVPLNNNISIKEMYLMIARLDNHPGRITKSIAPPGIITISRGLQKLYTLTQMFQILSIKT